MSVVEIEDWRLNRSGVRSGGESTGSVEIEDWGFSWSGIWSGWESAEKSRRSQSGGPLTMQGVRLAKKAGEFFG